MHNTEDKQWWIDNYGLPREEYFIENIAPSVEGVKVLLNPEKNVNPYAPDLITPEGKIADLKCQTTPFFKVKELFNLDPQFTVSFNKKDYERYSQNYPNIVVVFWVNWVETSYTQKGNGKIYTVKPMNGIWSCELNSINNWVKNSRVPLHKYYNRTDDKLGNAKDSYLLNLNEMYFHGIVNV
ncbi:hypothetical protein [Anaerospora hongkongensis]|uniref:hypothetical protein n=1 Tax=Anaerospora hongkongensis TaxID=244830 RepID=UPI00289DDBFC|nr:hypothetical protein [Anaerospora hongkongensis]